MEGFGDFEGSPEPRSLTSICGLVKVRNKFEYARVHNWRHIDISEDE